MRFNSVVAPLRHRRKELAESLAIRHDFKLDAVTKDSKIMEEIASIATDNKKAEIAKYNGTAYTGLQVWSADRILKKAQDYASKNTIRVLTYYKEICEGKVVAEKMKQAVLDGTAPDEQAAFVAHFQEQQDMRKAKNKLARQSAKNNIAAKSAEDKAKAAASQSAEIAKVPAAGAGRRYADDEAMDEDEPSAAAAAAAAEVPKKTPVGEKILDSMQRLSPEEQAYVAEALGWRKAAVASVGTSAAITQIRTIFNGHVADLNPNTESGQRQIIAKLSPLGPLGFFKVLKALL